MATLAEEIPFAAVVVDTALDVVCSSCFELKAMTTHFLCLAAPDVVYLITSKECQKNDWINHKHECRLLRSFSPHIPPSICRLMARVILKLERKDAHHAAFNGRRYEDLMDHRDDILKDEKRMEEFAAISLCMHNYMGEKHIPDKDVLMSIYGKVFINMIGIGEQPGFLAKGLYIGMCAHDHSCDPDAHLVFDGSKAILRSCRVKEYSMDVTVTYTHLLCTAEIRQKELRNNYYFTCTCSVCSDPTKDFLRNSARSICCPDSYCLLDPKATELSCFNCGKSSKISVKEAIFANQQVTLALRGMELARVIKLQFNGPLPTIYSNSVYAKELQELIEIHGKFSEVLSHFNVNLLRVTDKVFQLAQHVDDSICRKHAPNIVLAYKRYLSIGDPVLSVRLSLMAFSLSDEPSAKALELAEALATSLLTFDPRCASLMNDEREEAMTSCRMELQMNINS